MKKINVHKLLLSFLGSYLLMLVIPLIIGAVLYSVVIGIVKDNTERLNRSVLENTIKIIDFELEKMDEISNRMTFSSTIDTISGSDISERDKRIFYINEAREELSIISENNDLITYMYVYYSNMDLIISNDKVFFDPDKFYSKFFWMEDLSTEAWKDMLSSAERRTSILPSKKAGTGVTEEYGYFRGNLISYLRALPVNLNEKSGTVLHILIDEGKIHQFFGEIINIDENRWIAVMDEDGSIITEEGNEAIGQIFLDNTVDRARDRDQVIYEGEKYFISSASSDYNNWLYVIAVPYSTMMKQVNFVYRLAIILVLLLVVIGLLLAFYQARKKSSPVIGLLGLLSEDSETKYYGDKEVYQYLKGNIEEIKLSNSVLAERISEQQPLLKHDLISRVFEGDIQNNEEIQLLQEYSGIELGSRLYQILIIRIKGYEMVYKENRRELEIKRALVEDEVYSLFGSTSLVHYSKDLELTVLVGLPDYIEGEIPVQNYMAVLSRDYVSKLSEDYGIKVLISYSRPIESLTQVPDARYNAKRAMRYNLFYDEADVVSINDVPDSRSGYSYSSEQEIRLMNLIKSGDREQVVGLLEEVFLHNAKSEYMVPVMLRQLLSDIYGTLVKVSEETHFESDQLSEDIVNLAYALSEEDNYLLLFDRIKEAYAKLADNISNHKAKKISDLCQAITVYIGEHYADPNMSLTEIAEHFDLAEVYLSKFYKEQTGKKLFSEVEALRMTKAASLLMVDHMTVEHIASVSGFNSASVFRRAFKRYYGVSPSQYKKINNEKGKGTV